jgi:hypothetical protein
MAGCYTTVSFFAFAQPQFRIQFPHPDGQTGSGQTYSLPLQPFYAT